MKYFFDTEFLEGKQDKTLFGLKYGETKPTIDLISIGIVAEDGREYYAISKDFNIDEAWNRHCNSGWIRENVLRPIHEELYLKAITDKKYTKEHFGRIGYNLKDFKTLVNYYGLSNKEIACQINHFINPEILTPDLSKSVGLKNDVSPVFYAYYADYDWVVFCQLFGTMMDLPIFFPMYCKDLKQISDEAEIELYGEYKHLGENRPTLKQNVDYPKQHNEHNALDDARWNVELYKFLNSQKQ